MHGNDTASSEVRDTHHLWGLRGGMPLAARLLEDVMEGPHWCLQGGGVEEPTHANWRLHWSCGFWLCSVPNGGPQQALHRRVRERLEQRWQRQSTDNRGEQRRTLSSLGRVWMGKGGGASARQNTSWPFHTVLVVRYACTSAAVGLVAMGDMHQCASHSHCSSQCSPKLCTMAVTSPPR